MWGVVPILGELSCPHLLEQLYWFPSSHHKTQQSLAPKPELIPKLSFIFGI